MSAQPFNYEPEEPQPTSEEVYISPEQIRWQRNRNFAKDTFLVVDGIYLVGIASELASGEPRMAGVMGVAMLCLNGIVLATLKRDQEANS